MPKGVAKSGKRKPSPRVERISRICEVCGKERLYLPSQIRVREEHLQRKIRFCSKVCEAEHRKKPESLLEEIHQIALDSTCANLDLEEQKVRQQEAIIKANAKEALSLWPD